MNSLAIEDEIQDDNLLDDVVLVPSTLPIESFSSQLVTRLGINSQQSRADSPHLQLVNCHELLFHDVLVKLLDAAVYFSASSTLPCLALFFFFF